MQSHHRQPARGAFHGDFAEKDTSETRHVETVPVDTAVGWGFLVHFSWRTIVVASTDSWGSNATPFALSAERASASNVSAASKRFRSSTTDKSKPSILTPRMEVCFASRMGGSAVLPGVDAIRPALIDYTRAASNRRQCRKPRPTPPSRSAAFPPAPGHGSSPRPACGR